MYIMLLAVLIYALGGLFFYGAIDEADRRQPPRVGDLAVWTATGLWPVLVPLAFLVSLPQFGRRWVRRMLGLPLVLLLLVVACTTVSTEAPPTYASVMDELQVRTNDLNRTLVRCWDTPGCRGAILITWTPWDSSMAPAFFIRHRP